VGGGGRGRDTAYEILVECLTICWVKVLHSMSMAAQHRHLLSTHISNCLTPVMPVKLTVLSWPPGSLRRAHGLEFSHWQGLTKAHGGIGVVLVILLTLHVILALAR
jgi:hypothetical protein